LSDIKILLILLRGYLPVSINYLRTFLKLPGVLCQQPWRLIGEVRKRSVGHTMGYIQLLW